MHRVRFADPMWNNNGFWTHIHHIYRVMGVYPGTQLPLREGYMVALVAAPNRPANMQGGKPRNIAFFRKVLGPEENLNDGQWLLVKYLQEGVDYTDAYAGGSIDVDMLTGDVSLMMTFGTLNPTTGAVGFQVWEDFIPRGAFGPALEFPEVPSTGGLTEEEQRAIAWVVASRKLACT